MWIYPICSGLTTESRVFQPLEMSIPTVPSSVTIVKDCRGDFLRNATQKRIAATRYFLSFVVEINPETWPPTDNSLGID
ncbi:MAG: hypothetical protein QNJ68_06600 [Microcoleaceae cyanobacterium MO_207.B10]|nr:hypothetical protein [Microcoleaceae cyanobacterium MO_207.B10]